MYSNYNCNKIIESCNSYLEIFLNDFDGTGGLAVHFDI